MSRASLVSMGSLLLLLLGSPATWAQGSCDRACLRNMISSYLDAVVEDDPGAAPLAVGIRQTENAINVPAGAGVWKSVTGLGEVQRIYVDEVSGQAAYFGTVAEGRDIAIVTVRVKVEDRELTEAEWYIARENDPGLNGPRQPGGPPANLHNPAYLAKHPPPQRVVPRGERADRETLTRVVMSYFDALTSHDRTVALAYEGCGRAENGSPAPGGAFLPPADGSPAPAVGETRDCIAGLENFNLSMVVARRIPVVDVEAQVALSFGVFIRRPGSPTPRNVFSEWFVVDGAKIRTIYTSMFYPPPTLAVPNWPPLVGNWPLPAEIGPDTAP